MPETVTIRADSPSDGSITTATVTRLDADPSHKVRMQFIMCQCLRQTGLVLMPCINVNQG